MFTHFLLINSLHCTHMATSRVCKPRICVVCYRRMVLVVVHERFTDV